MSGVDFSDPAVIAILTQMLEAAGVEGIEVDSGGSKLRIVVEGGTSRAATVELPNERLAGCSVTTVTAMIAGIFGSCHPASMDAPAALPREVLPGDRLGFIRIGPVLLPIEAPGRGIVTRLLSGEGSLVGYGDPLFEIEPQP